MSDLVSRRSLFMAAAGALLGAVARAVPVSANDNDVLRAGQENIAQSQTTLKVQGTSPSGPPLWSLQIEGPAVRIKGNYAALVAEANDGTAVYGHNSSKKQAAGWFSTDNPESTGTALGAVSSSPKGSAIDAWSPGRAIVAHSEGGPVAVDVTSTTTGIRAAGFRVPLRLMPTQRNFPPRPGRAGEFFVGRYGGLWFHNGERWYQIAKNSSSVQTPT